jgi:hypothetical protein
MNARKAMMATVVCLPVLMGASKCPAGDSNPQPNTNAPGFQGQTVTPQGQPSCSITERGKNSHNRYYITFGCTDGTTGAVLLIGPNDLPNCTVGTFWDACAK